MAETRNPKQVPTGPVLGDFFLSLPFSANQSQLAAPAVDAITRLIASAVSGALRFASLRFEPVESSGGIWRDLHGKGGGARGWMGLRLSTSQCLTRAVKNDLPGSNLRTPPVRAALPQLSYPPPRCEQRGSFASIGSLCEYRESFASIEGLTS